MPYPCHLEQVRALEPIYMLAATASDGSLDVYLTFAKGKPTISVAKRIHKANVLCARVTAQDMYELFSESHTNLIEEGRRPAKNRQKRSFDTAALYKGGPPKPILGVVGGYEVATDTESVDQDV